MKRLFLMVAGIGLGLAALSAQAQVWGGSIGCVQAGGRSGWSFSLGVGGGGICAPAPLYVSPPVCVAPPPVVYAPAPVYLVPAPVVYARPAPVVVAYGLPVWRHPVAHRHHGHRW